MRMLSSAARLLLLAVAAAPLAAGRLPSRHRASVPARFARPREDESPAAGGRGGQAQTVAQANKCIDGNPIRIGGKEFAERRRHARDERAVREPERRRRAFLGDGRRGRQSDRAAARAAGQQPPAPPPPPTPIVFRVVGDGRVLHVSKPVVRGDAPEPFDVDVRGIKTLVLRSSRSTATGRSPRTGPTRSSM